MAETPTNEEWLASALRSIGDPMIATDGQGCIMWMNPGAETLTGFGLAQAQKRPLAEVLALYDEATGLPSASQINLVLNPQGPEHVSAACYLLRRPGLPECPIEVSCFRIHAEPLASGAILICRDLSASRTRERVLVQAERLDAIANLSGGVAHDLNNHLTVIHGYVDELRHVTGLDDQTPVQEIAQAAHGAAGMARSLLGVARRSISNPEVLVLSDVVAEMEATISRLLADRRKLRLIADSGEAKVKADPTLLKQVLLGFAVFARDAKPPGGEFCIETGTVEIANSVQTSGGNGTGSYSRLRISFHGDGLDQQTVSRIFEPFRISRGLGLAQVHGIVAQCGGFIQAAAAAAGGITFEVLLPRVSQTGMPAEVSDSPPSSGGDTPLTVLLVEDDASVRRLVHTYMDRAGFNLLEAATAEDALRLAEAYEDPIHVLVTDVVLPGISGRELADKLKAVRPPLKVLLVSGFPRNTLVHTSAATGHGFLPKPFRANQLVESIRRLVQEEVESRQTM